MSEITRREAVGRLALAFLSGAAIDRAAAQALHHAGAQSAASGGAYTPKALSPREFRTLERLTDLIVPVENGKPGALQAEVPAWIDTLLAVNDELKAKYTTGLAWLDTAIAARGAADFATATREQQTALLDQIAYRKNRSPQLDPGIDFFILARRMTVDGFYTSRVGMRDIYPGNTPRSAFTVPPEAIAHVLKRSPL
jgi:gluconate 2-dehydrogenase subunit 3-like protein